MSALEVFAPVDSTTVTAICVGAPVALAVVLVAARAIHDRAKRNDPTRDAGPGWLLGDHPDDTDPEPLDVDAMWSDVLDGKPRKPWSDPNAEVDHSLPERDRQVVEKVRDAISAVTDGLPERVVTHVEISGAEVWDFLKGEFGTPGKTVAEKINLGEIPVVFDTDLPDHTIRYVYSDGTVDARDISGMVRRWQIRNAARATLAKPAEPELPAAETLVRITCGSQPIFDLLTEAFPGADITIDTGLPEQTIRFIYADGHHRDVSAGTRPIGSGPARDVVALRSDLAAIAGDWARALGMEQADDRQALRKPQSAWPWAGVSDFGQARWPR